MIYLCKGGPLDGLYVDKQKGLPWFKEYIGQSILDVDPNTTPEQVTDTPPSCLYELEIRVDENGSRIYEYIAKED